MSSVPWPPGSATGIGSLPGTNARDAVATVFGELPDFPYLPELPARGPGADMIGRTAAMLVELPVETVPSGWRFTDHAGRDMRRATAWLSADLDAFEETAQGYGGVLKIQVAGPWTLAAAIELRHGDKALADPGAARDVAASLAEGLRSHIADVRKRAPAAAVVLQVDEPSLPAVLAGAVGTASGYGALAAVQTQVAEAGLAEVLVAAEPATPVVHCCAAAAPVDLFVRAGARAIALDFALVSSVPEDLLPDALDGGVCLFAGVVPASDTARADGDGAGAEMSEVSATVDLVRGWWRRLGFDPEKLAAQVVVTPACGLAGASPAHARAAMAHCRQAARVLREEPEE